MKVPKKKERKFKLAIYVNRNQKDKKKHHQTFRKQFNKFESSMDKKQI